MALDFSVTGAKVDYGSDAGFDDLQAFTLSAWIYRTTDDVNNTIFSKCAAGSAGWVFLIDNVSGSGQLRILRFRSGTTLNFDTAVGSVPLNTWTHVALVYDEAATPRVKIYKGGMTVDDVEATYTISENGTGTLTTDAAANLYVGGLQFADSFNFKGRIGRGSLITEVLTLAEINALKHEYIDNHDITNTELLFDFTTAASNQPDLSGNGNDGTMSGATFATHPPFFEITDNVLPAGTVGAAYGQNINLINQQGANQVAEVLTGTLPTNTTLGFTGGNNIPRISGTPTTANNYPFRLRVEDDSNFIAEKNLSIQINASGGDTTPPTAPDNLTGTVLSSVRIDLSWSASFDFVGVAGYTLQRATDINFTQNLQTFTLGNVTSYSDTGLTPNTRYYYQVNARDAVPNTSAYSQLISRKTLPAFTGSKTFTGVYSGMCADTDNLHVVTGTAPDNILHYRSTDEGATWDIDGVNIGNGTIYLEEPFVANGAGKLAVFYFKNLKQIRDFFGWRDVGELFCKVSLNGGTTWQSERLVSGVVVPGEGFRMSACWNGNSLHVNWMDFKNVPNDVETDPDNQTKSWDIYYNRCVDVTANLNFEGEQNLAPCETGNKTGQVRPSISKSGNSIFSVWFAGIPGKGSCTIDTGSTTLPQCSEIFIQRNQNNGAAGSWETKIQLTNNTSPIKYSGRNTSCEIPTGVLITFDRGGAAQGATNDIYGIRIIDNGNTIQAEFPIVEDPNSQTHSATVQKGDFTHIVWGDYGNAGALLYKQSSNNGASFGITEDTGLAGIVPFTDATTNYIHVLGSVGGVATHKRRLLPSPDTEPPTVPTNLYLTSFNSRIDAFWSASFDDTGVVGYDLERAEDNNFTNFQQNFQSFTLGNVLSYSDTSVVNGTTYFYRVQARDGYGRASGFSPEQSATPGLINFPYPLIRTNLELFAEGQTQTQTEGQVVPSFNDISGKNRHLVANSNQPTIATTGGFKEIRIQRTNNVLKHTGTFIIRCGWILAKVNGNFVSYDGLLSGLNEIDYGILLGNPGTNKFFNANLLGFEFWDFRLNDKIYPPTNALAPIDAWKLIFFKSSIPFAVQGIQIGKDRNQFSRDLDGSVRMLALYSNGFDRESDIRAQSKIIADFYGLTLEDVFPYQADKRGSAFNSRTAANIYDAPEGERISEVLDTGTFEGDLNFSSRKQSEVLAMELYHKNHYPEVKFIYRNYKYTPPVDFEGHFDSDYEMDGANNNFSYSFKFKGKKVE